MTFVGLFAHEGDHGLLVVPAKGEYSFCTRVRLPEMLKYWTCKKCGTKLGFQDTRKMITSMLLGIYVPNMGGFRHGDMFLITKDGCENLTPYEQRIIV